MLGPWANNELSKEYFFLGQLEEDDPNRPIMMNEIHKEILEVNKIESSIKGSCIRKTDYTKILAPPKKLRP